MTFERTPLAGAYIVHLEPNQDDRGFFARTWCVTELADHGLDAQLSQASISYNRCRGILRGMHYRVEPHAETKVVRCTRGAIYDVIVDLRPRSASYLRWFAEVLTSDNRKSLYVPEGFAHGYQTLQDDTEVFYMISKPHNPEAERGLRWDDPALGITWPHVESRIMSARDQNWPTLDPNVAT
jgi:dTDP-4-dehydrorhamnose 3,5-epimerase